MINLLPPEIRAQQYYAQLNTGLRRYVILSIVIGGLLISVLLIGNLFTTMFTRDIESKLVQQEKRMATYQETEQKAREINDQMKQLVSVLGKTTRYSDILTDLATNLPQGSRVTGFAFTGNPQEPLVLTIVANSEQTALKVQPTLETMERFSFVDIQEFRNVGSSYEVELALAFKDQQAAQR